MALSVPAHLCRACATEDCGLLRSGEGCNEGNGTEGEKETFTELTCTIPAPQPDRAEQESARECELWLSGAKEEQSHAGRWGWLRGSDVLQAPGSRCRACVTQNSLSTGLQSN